MREVLVHRVVGVEERCLALAGDALGEEEGGELALAVHDVWSPADEVAKVAMRERHLQPCVGVDEVCADRAEVADVALAVGVELAGEREDAHLVPQRLKALGESEDGGDDAVNDRLVPIGCEEYPHSGHGFIVPINTTRAVD